MKVYLVSTGAYSAHGVRGVFSTQELAEAYRRTLIEPNPGEDSYVEEWEVDAEVGKVWRDCFYATIGLEDGEIVGEHGDRILARPGDRTARPNYGYTGDESRKLVCSLVSAEHARKLAVEARQEWLRKAAVHSGM